MFARLALRRLFGAELKRNALRVEVQGRSWSLEELERHSDAFSLGVQELGFRQHDKIVTWLDPKHGSEIVTAQYGCLKSGVTLVPIFGDDPADFFAALADDKVRGAIISPNRRVGSGQKQSEALLSRFAELAGHHAGSPLRLQSLPHLQYIVHTGFYSIPGTHKFKDLLLYGNSNFLTFQPRLPADDAVVFAYRDKTFTRKSLDKLAASVAAVPEHNIASIADPNCPVAFAKTVLAAVQHRKYSILLSGVRDVPAVLRHIPDTAVLHDQRAEALVLDQLRSLGLGGFISTSNK